MDVFAIGALSIAPGIFWLWFFYKKDTLEPEPKSLIVRMFFFGMLSLVPAALAEFPLRGMTFVQLVIAAPIIEECIKFSVVRYAIYSHREFDEPMDGIMYAIAVALGFASSENALSILTSYLAPQIALGMSDPVFALGFVWKLYIVRALLTVPGHAIWSSMWGYAIGWTKFAPQQRLSPVLKGILIAIVLHALFNYLVTYYIPGAVGMLVLVPVMWRMVYNRIERALAQSPHSRSVQEGSADEQHPESSDPG